jgi:hypothetical protein
MSMRADFHKSELRLATTALVKTFLSPIENAPPVLGQNSIYKRLRLVSTMVCPNIRMTLR